MDGLTALERELLAYVERLTQASEASARELTASGQITRKELDGLRICVTALLKSQVSLAEALNGLAQQHPDIVRNTPELRNGAAQIALAWKALDAI